MPLAAFDIVAFVPTTNARRAVDFYRDKLRLPLVSQDSFAAVFDANGTMLRVATVPKLSPAPFTVLGWSVPDIAAAATELRKAGIPCERFPGMDQDELGVWSAPGGAKVAWFKDPDGNILSISQH